jgi:hypothetical protein
MGKKSKRIKKDKIIVKYTRNERNNIINNIKTKLIELGIGIYIEVQKLFIIMNIFIENGIDYINTINLIDCNKKLIVNLKNNKKYEIYVNIKELEL